MPTPVTLPATEALAPGSELIDRLRAGEADALTLAWQSHAATLLLLARRLLGPDDGPDAVQDLFVALPEAMGQYREQGQFGAWLKRLLVRIALMRLRSRRRRRETPLEAETAAAPATPLAGAERWDLTRALARLSPDQRIVVVLKAVEGYSHEEIGELLGLRRNTCEVRYHRALRLLRHSLEASG